MKGFRGERPLCCRCSVTLCGRSEEQIPSLVKGCLIAHSRLSCPECHGESTGKLLDSILLHVSCMILCVVLAFSSAQSCAFFACRCRVFALLVRLVQACPLPCVYGRRG